MVKIAYLIHRLRTGSAKSKLTPMTKMWLPFILLTFWLDKL